MLLRQEPCIAKLAEARTFSPNDALQLGTSAASVQSEMQFECLK